MPAKLTAVSSSTISGYAYDRQTQRLVVEFNTGKAYLYSDVPLDTVQRFREAESKGRFFGVCIRDRFATQPLSPEDLREVLASFDPGNWQGNAAPVRRINRTPCPTLVQRYPFLRMAF